MQLRLRLRYWLKNLAIGTGTIGILRGIRDRLAPAPSLDYPLLERTGELPVPQSVTIEPTLACNLRCSMCFQNEYRNAGIARELRTDGLLTAIEHLPRETRSVYFVGGEVFLRMGFPRLLEAVEARGLETFITTNGTRIPDTDWAALDHMQRLTGIGFSLDGIGPAHDAIRGEGTYEKTVDSIRRALARHRVYASFVMMESNIPQMIAFSQTIAALGVREIGFQHEMYCLPDDVENTRRQLDLNSASKIMMTVKRQDWSEDSVAQLKAALGALPAVEQRHGFVAAFEPPLPPRTLPWLYDGTIRKRTRLFCREFTNLFIDPAGNVVHCGFLRKKFGNVLDQPIEAIWNSPAMRGFRKALIDTNLAPACRRCCKLGIWPNGATPNPVDVAGDSRSM